MANAAVSMPEVGEGVDVDTLRYREVQDDVEGTPFKHRIAEIHAISMKRLSKVEAADDPADGADDE